MGRKPFVIVNPMAANRRVAKEWSRIQKTLERRIGPFEYAQTRSPSHATEVTRQALQEGYRDLGSLGGDGTHSLVVNGFFAAGKPIAPDATLSILPVGTGGDFKRLLRSRARDLAGFAELMARDESVAIDVGHIRHIDHDGLDAERYFLNISSFGMSGEVVRIVNRSSKALGGAASFLIGTLRALKSYTPPRVTITVDGKRLEPVRVFVAAACNGQYFGGGMRFGPEADPRDGQLDLVVMPWRSRFYHATRGLGVYTGAHLSLPGVTCLRCREIRAKSEGPCLLDVDGEAPGRLPVEIRVVPGALRLKGLAA